MPFDRVNGDKKVGGNWLFFIECTSTCECAIYHQPICQLHGAKATFTKKCVLRRPPHNALRSREQWYIGGLLLPLLYCMYINMRTRK